MSATSVDQQPEESPCLSSATAADYLQLMKPRVMTLVVFTGTIGYLLAPQLNHPVLGIIALFALAMGAGAAGAMNMVLERDIDAGMKRTRSRPLPMGKMHHSDAMAFAAVMAVLALVLIWMTAGVLTAALLAFSIFFYAVIYTVWLKPHNSQNIVIGGAAGAMPPMIGWAAASGSLSWDSLMLFLIIFLWTPPHFWSLALFSHQDYARVGLPMLPNTHGLEATKRSIFGYSLLLIPVSLSPVLIGTLGWFYGVAAVGLGWGFLWFSYKVLWSGNDMRPARTMFLFSIVYLFSLFAIMPIDRLLSAWLWG